MYRAFKDQNVQFIGIFVRDTEAAVRRFVNTYGLTFPVGLDDGMRIASSYNFVGTPFTVIISRDGLIADAAAALKASRHCDKR
jgi:cytochrome c biogenesis protein CcmG, thiol:disulfide interchange protein DsbE